jgi:hypothetical protein
VRLEWLGQLRKSNDLIGNRTCDLPACSVPPRGEELRMENVVGSDNYINSQVCSVPCQMRFMGTG